MTVSEADFHYVRKLVHDDTGIVIESDKHYLVDSRLQKFKEKFESLDVLMERLRNDEDPVLRKAVVEAMAIHETYFFRDPWLFDSLKNEVIPALINNRYAQREIRIWCGAASTGQEILSICFLLKENFPELDGWHITLVASDFSDDALAKARSGIYSMPEVNRGLPIKLLTKYFFKSGLNWSVKSEILKGISFLNINLVDDWPELPLFDIILIRNVLIYFDEEDRRSVLSRAANQLRHDGYLFMGGTESPTGIISDFVPVTPRGAYYYRKKGA